MNGRFIMKRYLAIVLMLVTLLTAGCSTAVPTDSQQKEQTQTQQQSKDTKSNQDTKSQTESKEKAVATLPTIGDTQADWENEWGHPYSQGDTIRVFHNGRYQVVFQNGRAVSDYQSPRR